MKILKRKNSIKNKIILVLVVIALLIATSFVYFFILKRSLFGWSPIGSVSSNSSINYEKPTDEQKNAGNAIKNNSVTDSEKDTRPSSDRPTPPIPQEDGRAEITVFITAASQNGSLVQVRSSLGIVTNSGTCTLKVTNGNAVIKKTAPVQPLASASTCQGFDIPVTELGAGTWSLSLFFENDDVYGNASKDIVVAS